jgi:acylphosphatase
MTRQGDGDFGPPETDQTTGGSQERREVFFSGRVQGVGFRYTTRGIAAQLPVVGWVRNLPDGRVQLVVEGSARTIDELLIRVEGELGRYIRGKEMTVHQATGEFSSFEVAR